jgi:hypothetical protein
VVLIELVSASQYAAVVAPGDLKMKWKQFAEK